MLELDHATLSVLGRKRPLFNRDLGRCEAVVSDRVRGRSFLVMGGAGSIGQAVVKALFRRQPARLHVVDVSENNLVELVREVRSSYGYMAGDFQTLPLDCGDLEFKAFLEESEPYDYVLNFMAMKHVRSEKDGFTLMRMIRTNVLNTETTLAYARATGASRYFAVSSDKAANPANALGATKRVMELCLIRASEGIEVSSARFANVAFSDGSLLHGFTRRLAKRQPLSAPREIQRYFITADEASTLCLMSCLLGGNRESFFPKLSEAVDFVSIAERFLTAHGYRAHPCATEDEARNRVDELAARGRWPCYFFASDTTGEKMIEEFLMTGESVDLDRYHEVGVIGWPPPADDGALDRFLEGIRDLRDAGRWTREEILERLRSLLPEFRHQETGKFLDARM